MIFEGSAVVYSQLLIREGEKRSGDGVYKNRLAGYHKSVYLPIQWECQLPIPMVS